VVSSIQICPVSRADPIDGPITTNIHQVTEVVH
jgi:hypothetical protein